MSVKLLTEHHLEFLSLKGGCIYVCLSLHLSKCHIVGNHMSRLNYLKLAAFKTSIFKIVSADEQAG